MAAARRVLGVLGFLAVGFMLYTLLMSSPFERLLPYFPVEGRDLNPLLQDPGMIIHPPLLYMGYVGLSVSFSFAIAALLTGQLDNLWAKWSRPWTMAAWGFLTLGITIGSWWAYAELGWGAGGSGISRKRLTDAVAGGHRIIALFGDHGKTRHL